MAVTACWCAGRRQTSSQASHAADTRVEQPLTPRVDQPLKPRGHKPKSRGSSSPPPSSDTASKTQDPLPSLPMFRCLNHVPRTRQRPTLKTDEQDRSSKDRPNGPTGSMKKSPVRKSRRARTVRASRYGKRAEPPAVAPPDTKARRRGAGGQPPAVAPQPPQNRPMQATRRCFPTRARPICPMKKCRPRNSPAAAAEDDGRRLRGAQGRTAIRRSAARSPIRSC